MCKTDPNCKKDGWCFTSLFNPDVYKAQQMYDRKNRIFWFKFIVGVVLFVLIVLIFKNL